MTNNRVKVNQAELIKLYRQALVDNVPLEKLDKSVAKLVYRSEVTKKLETKAESSLKQKFVNQLPKVWRFGAAVLPMVMILFGVLLVSSAVLPIVGYFVETLPALKAKQLASPIPQEKVLDVTPLIIAQAKANEGKPELGKEVEQDNGPIILDAKLDYTNLNNWFENSSLPMVGQQGNRVINKDEVKEYRLDIPKVNIDNAVVKVGGTDLNTSLVHYAGTALPGENGSVVIFGHSVLRQFYNPKESNSRRYMSMFSTIMTLTKGEKIYLTIGNIKYTYMVQEKTEVKPTDVYILAQRYDVRQLKLVTCVPEGTYLRRGVVTAQLVVE